jgi:hypothetical protein
MSQTKAQLVGGVGISTAQNVVVGSAVTINSTGINVVGVVTTNNVSVSSSVTASQFFGDGSNLTNTGSTLSAASGSQRVVVTTQTSGTMTASATDGDLTFDSNSNTLNTANLHVTGISTLGTTNGIGKVTIGIGTTALLVEGNARVTGILSVGQGTIALDGNSDNIRVGTAVTLNSSGVTAGIITATTGCIRGTITAGTATVPGTVTGGVVCATSCFSGNGSGLSNIPSSAITGLSGGGGFCVFTNPGTFTVPPGTTSLKITATGGGGSTPGLPPSIRCVIGGGGAGSAAVKLLSVPPACSSYPVTVGGAGGDTIFGGPTVFLTHGGCIGCSGPCLGNDACGGFGGGAPGSNGNSAPATATYGIFSNTATFPTTLQCGTISCHFNGRGYRVDPGVTIGGAGASGPFGVGGTRGNSIDPTTIQPGCPGCGYGSGAGGVIVAPPAGGCATGANGAPGLVIVEW